MLFKKITENLEWKCTVGISELWIRCTAAVMDFDMYFEQINRIILTKIK